MTDAAHAVLVVDDEPQLRRLLRTTLTAEGFRVIEADTARRGLIEAASHKPDLVILDLGLPDAEGHTVVRGIREWSSLPIVVLSARVDEQQKIAALDAGADDYVDEAVRRRRIARACARGAPASRAADRARSAAAARQVTINLTQRTATGSRRSDSLHAAGVSPARCTRAPRRCGGDAAPVAEGGLGPRPGRPAALSCAST